MEAIPAETKKDMGEGKSPVAATKTGVRETVPVASKIFEKKSHTGRARREDFPTVGPSFDRQGSSSEQPSSLLQRAANLLVTPGSSVFQGRHKATECQTSFLGDSSASRPSVYVPGQTGVKSEQQNSPSTLAQNYTSWQPTSFMWKWIRAGSSAPLATRPPRDDDEAPLTLSPPARERQENVKEVTVRSSWGPSVDVEVVRKESDIANSKQVLQKYMSNATRTDSSSHESTSSRGQYDRLQSFCSAKSLPEHRSVGTNMESRPSFPDPSDKMHLYTTHTSVLDSLIGVTGENYAPWSLNQISDVLSDAFYYDVHENDTDDLTCRSARLLVFLHMLTYDDKGKLDHCNVARTVVQSLVSNWSRVDVDLVRAHVVHVKPLILVHGDYLSHKLRFIETYSPLFEGNYSVARFLRRLAIEKTDQVRRKINERQLEKLFSTKTLAAIVSVMGVLVSILRNLAGCTTSSYGSTENDSKDDKKGQLNGIDLHQGVDFTTRELLQLAFVSELFYQGAAVKGLVEGGAQSENQSQIDGLLAEGIESVEKLSRKNTLLQQAFKSGESGVVYLDAKTLATATDSHVAPADLALHSSVAISNEPALTKRTSSEQFAFPLSRNGREIECTFSSFKHFHDAIEKEMPRLENSQIQ